MYGFVEEGLVAYVQSLPDGGEKMKQIRKAANVSHRSTNFHHSYPDEVTLSLITAATKVLDISAEECLAQMGTFQAEVLVDQGYLPLIKSLGNSFYELLLHLNAMHLNLVKAYPAMRGPAFKPERQEDGSLILHYHSSREGLAPYAMALLKDVAAKVYSVDIDIKLEKKKGVDLDHDTFRIFMPPEGYGETGSLDSESDTQATGKLTLDASMTDTVFPWHVAIDRDLRIASLGPSIKDRVPADVLGAPFMNLFRVVQPDIRQCTFDELATSHSHQAVVVEVLTDTSAALGDSCPFSAAMQSHNAQKPRRRPNGTSSEITTSSTNSSGTPSEGGCPYAKSEASSQHQSQEQEQEQEQQPAAEKEKVQRASCLDPLDASLRPIGGIEILGDGLFLKGELVYNPDHDVLMFLCIPTFSSVEEMERQHLCLESMPIHSNGRELMISTAHQSAVVHMTKKLQATTASLDHTMAELDKEKERVDGLLHSILPAQVAEALKTGSCPAPERYKAVSILFSDIVNFTKISSSVPVIEVMDMLNELFSKFDELCTKYGVYKVETIGDAYMVASGLPKADPRHADLLAGFAIEMVAAAETVTSPMDGEPLNIRVGMHSGKIMAGVVGSERPRYCLFGDTVNVASRMESTGVGGAVQVSYAFIKALPDREEWNLFQRGNVKVKGKGEMKTFFLLGRAGSSMQLPPPDAGAYESEVQTPAYSAGSSSGYHSPFPYQQQGMPPAAPVAPAPRTAPTAVPKPDVMYQVLVHGQGIDIKLPYVPSSMTLGELMKELTPQASVDGDTTMRFYLDEFHQSMLLPRMTLQQLHTSLVTSKVIKSGSRSIVLHANSCVVLSSAHVTQHRETRTTTLSFGSPPAAPSNDLI